MSHFTNDLRRDKLIALSYDLQMLWTHSLFFKVESSCAVLNASSLDLTKNSHTWLILTWEFMERLYPIHTFVIAAFAMGHHAVIIGRMFIKYILLIYDEHHKCSDLGDNCHLHILIHYYIFLLFIHQAWKCMNFLASRCRAIFHVFYDNL